MIGRRSLLIGAIAAASSAACDRKAPESKQGLRVAVAGGPITEIVFALGGGEAVVGTDTSSTFPATAAALPKFGYQRQLAAEGILSLTPGLFLASDEAGPPEVLEHLRQAGVRVETISTPKEKAAIAKRVAAVGAAIGATEAGARLASELDAAIVGLTKRAEARPSRPRVLFLYARGQGTMMVGGRDTSADLILELAGCTNAAAELSGFVPLTPEAAVGSKAEIVLVPEKGLASLGGKSGLFATPGLAETPAAKSGRAVAVDDLLLLGLGPRVADAIDAVTAQVFV
ncbi:MAG: ABC transporter substrate-binding protein [Myxococcales bacterium]|nr:ABC transporter substrate-binding protein [Myxococcales bacterium]